MQAAWSHCCTLTSQEAVSALACPNLASCWWAAGTGLFVSCCQAGGTGCIFLTFAQLQWRLVFPSSLQPKMPVKSYSSPLILKIYTAFLFQLKLSVRLKSFCEAVWEKNKDRQTDSNAMTLISLGNQAKKENVTSDPLLRALKARVRTYISQIRNDICGDYSVLVAVLKESRK